MPSSQNNAQAFNPNSLNLVRVASYKRLIEAPLIRAWENVLDWAHLSHLHATTFGHIALDEAGPWGWRTWSNVSRTDYIELCVVDDARYVARSYERGQQVSEIWTTLGPEGERTRVDVEFYFPDIDDSAIEMLGDAIVGLYTQLWDEDEDMMCQRHVRLTERRNDASEIELGSETALLQRLQAGASIHFQLARCEYQLRAVNGTLMAHSSICPHLLGPLTDVDISSGTVRCPWHGYEFDLASGECLVPAQAQCKLAPAPTLVNVEGSIIARR